MKKIIPSVFIISLLIALTLVFSQSPSIDIQRVQTTQKILTNIAYQGTILERDMLKVHHGSITHYDTLIQTYKLLNSLQAQVQLLLLHTPQTKALLNNLQHNLDLQVSALEYFMAAHATVTNSLQYLPIAIAKDAAQNITQDIHVYHALHRDILQYVQTPNKQTHEKIQLQTQHLNISQALQQHIRTITAQSVNAQLALDRFHHASEDDATSKLSSLIEAQLASDLEQNDDYKRLLLIIMLLLITYVGKIIWQRVATTKKLRQALRTVETQQSALNEHAIVAVLDTSGVITYANDKFCTISGYHKEELHGEHYSIVHSNQHSKAFIETLWDTISQGKIWHNTTHNKAKDGDDYWVDTTIVPFVDDDKKPYQYVSIGTDISHIIKQEQEQRVNLKKLEHAQRLESLGLLAGGIAHDFNNLLTAILGNISLIDRDLNPNHPMKDNVNRVIKASERAANLCRQMLAYSGKGHFVIQPTDLSELVKEMVELLLVSIDNNVVIKYELDDNLPKIDADIAQIQQVVMNLITNANEAMEGKDGVLSIATGWLYADQPYLNNIIMAADLAEGNYVYLEVSDNGCGMDQKTIRKIFEPFFTTKFAGRGLGMSALQGIVRGHKGAITVYSELGRGTTFKILIPISKNNAFNDQNKEAITSSDWKVDGGYALIVDDDEEVRHMASTILRHLGFDVLEAENGLEAIQLYPQHAKDIRFVLLDMSMPKMDGEETFRELRKLNPDVRVILSSGYSETESTQRFHGKGLAGFVQKPYLPDTLQTAAAKALQD